MEYIMCLTLDIWLMYVQLLLVCNERNGINMLSANLLY
uniref:Uncharacterized protein n=1 Tax=Arundo donax TaxID=35708 RepID=A0A0A9BXM1_ARUDO